ncbi:MAG: restriction endonuclease subunit S [Ignavibacteriae bacterium]|nr:restriction endonuclease subunit S [Ignavibacteriota bacterium]
MSYYFRDGSPTLFPNLPKGWREERIHDVADLRTSSVDKKSEDGENPVELCNYVDVYKNDKITARLDFMKATATAAQIERFSIRVGDVIITKDSETPEDIGVPAYVAETKPSIVCGYHLTMIRPNEEFVHGAYLFYAIKSRLSAYQFYLAANGVTRFGLTFQGTKNLRIAFPALTEQKHIADFLDWKTGQIDALIAKKQQLIEKLEEKRIAVITQAVTKGLNPDVPMKDSGIPWLGEVPEHWELKKLRFMFKFGRGLGITKADLIDAGIPCVNYGEIHSRYGFEVVPEIHNLKCVPEDYLKTNINSLLSYGDFIFADTSEDIGGSGNFTYLNSHMPTFAGYHTVTAKLSKESNPRYLAYLFDSQIFRYQIRKNISGVKVFSITQGLLKSCCAWLPTNEEQSRIVEFLDQKCDGMDRIEKSCYSAITRLTEYRTALITAATTGKIDVRDIQIPPTE